MQSKQLEKTDGLIREMVEMLKDRIGYDVKFVLAVSAAEDEEFSSLSSDPATALQFTEEIQKGIRNFGIIGAEQTATIGGQNAQPLRGGNV
ncbi:MAG: hypothetical protein V3R83_09795 [Gammaproteobacteria bacterium]